MFLSESGAIPSCAEVNVLSPTLEHPKSTSTPFYRHLKQHSGVQL